MLASLSTRRRRDPRRLGSLLRSLLPSVLAAHKQWGEGDEPCVLTGDGLRRRPPADPASKPPVPRHDRQPSIAEESGAPVSFGTLVEVELAPLGGPASATPSLKRYGPGFPSQQRPSEKGVFGLAEFFHSVEIFSRLMGTLKPSPDSQGRQSAATNNAPAPGSKGEVPGHRKPGRRLHRLGRQRACLYDRGLGGAGCEPRRRARRASSWRASKIQPR